MIKFITWIVGLLLTSFLVLEIVLRIFSLSSHTVPKANIDGDLLSKPYSEGYWAKGACREIYSHYKINAQGFNSLRDFQADIKNDSLSKIALVGDSYIEGLHVDVEKSIGNKIENKLENNWVVHEYANSGGNFHDYKILYKKYDLYLYDYVFILLQKNDVKAVNPGFMTHGKIVAPKSAFRTFYNNCHVLRYLNINRGFQSSLRKLFTKKTTKPKPTNTFKNRISVDNYFGDNTVIIYDDLLEETLNIIDFPKLEIQHIITPKNFAFDRHWNDNGRKNCANTVVNYIHRQKVVN